MRPAAGPPVGLCVMQPRVEAGAVFRWSHDDRPIRLLIHDGDVVMYDAWWPHLGTWGLANLDEARRKRISYYVTLVSAVLEKAVYLRTEPLTDEEVATHRPDLPYAAVRSAKVQWPQEAPGSADQFAAQLRAAGLAVDSTALDQAECYLFPFGPDGGRKRGVRVRVDNGTTFTVGELLWKATVIQAPFVRGELPAQGVGIYRDGLERGIPSYYLWGDESRMHTEIAAAIRRRQTLSNSE